MKKNIYIIGLLILTLFIVPNAQTLEDIQKEKEELQKEYEEKQNELNKLENDLSAAENEYYIVSSNITTTENNINQKNIEINQTQKNIDNTYAAAKEVIVMTQTMKYGTPKLNFIFEGDTMGEIVKNAKLMQEITNYNIQTLNYLMDLSIQLEKEKAELELASAELELQKDYLAGVVVVLENQVHDHEESALSSAEEIAYIEETIEVYTSLGCSSTDVIGVDCAQGITDSRFVRPTENGYITCRWYCYSNHTAIDIGNGGAAAVGTPIYPVAGGTVVTASYGYNGGFGNWVVIHHNVNGIKYTSIYAHLNDISVSPGQRVDRTTQIGTMGNTGNSQGPHLHLEILENCWMNLPGECTTSTRKNGYAINPESLINFPSQNYVSWNDRYKVYAASSQEYILPTNRKYYA